MAATGQVGVVSEVWRFPVKSMLGEALDAAAVTEGGVAGDRAYALVDRETGKVVSAKHPSRWPDLLSCRARYLEDPVPGAAAPSALIDLPDGTSLRTDAPDADGVLSRFFGRDVLLARAAPADFTIDQYHPDVDGLDPEGHRDELTEVRLGAAFFDERGLRSAVPQGSFLDLFPVSVLSTSTLHRLEELEPASRFDVRRFRMNVIVDTPGAGFVENAWIGHRLQLGDEAELAVALPDPRCCMPSLAQPGLPRDTGVLRTLVRSNRLDVAGAGRFPCAGVYAVAAATGSVRRGDEVRLV